MVLALAGGTALTGASAFAATDGKIAKIGLVQSTTGGSAALYGTTQKQAIDLAFDEINAAGTLKGITIRSIYADDGGDRGQTVNVYERLIRQDEVIAILGPSLSNSAFAADPIAQQAGIPVIASSNTAPNLTKIGDFIFRTSVPEDQVFPSVLRYAIARHAIKRVALVYGLDDALTRGAYDVQKQAVASLGLQTVGTESYQHGDVVSPPSSPSCMRRSPTPSSSAPWSRKRPQSCARPARSASAIRSPSSAATPISRAGCSILPAPQQTA